MCSVGRGWRVGVEPLPWALGSKFAFLRILCITLAFGCTSTAPSENTVSAHLWTTSQVWFAGKQRYWSCCVLRKNLPWLARDLSALQQHWAARRTLHSLLGVMQIRLISAHDNPLLRITAHFRKSRVNWGRQ